MLRLFLINKGVKTFSAKKGAEGFLFQKNEGDEDFFNRQFFPKTRPGYLVNFDRSLVKVSFSFLSTKFHFILSKDWINQTHQSSITDTF